MALWVAAVGAGICLLFISVEAFYFLPKRWPATSARPCAGVRWRRAFPEASADEIREFLKLIQDAMFLPEHLTFKIRPDDTIRFLYDTEDGGASRMADHYEVECLVDEFEERYGICPELQADTTLAQILVQAQDHLGRPPHCQGKQERYGDFGRSE